MTIKILTFVVNFLILTLKFNEIETLKLTLTAVGSVVAELALTLPEDALPAAVAALRAVASQLR
jgi:hypothetical protein